MLNYRIFDFDREARATVADEDRAKLALQQVETLKAMKQMQKQGGGARAPPSQADLVRKVADEAPDDAVVTSARLPSRAGNLCIKL